jgi:hypothetical protein
VLEAHFLRGSLAAAGRRSDFSRLYDLPERLIPAEHRSRHVEYDEGRRALLMKAARAHAVGTAKDLADYFRMPVGEASLAELGRVCASWWSRASYTRLASRAGGRSPISTRKRRCREALRQPRSRHSIR